MAELTRRYIVMPMGTEGPFDSTDPDAPFVLKPWKDPAALLALEAYRAACYPELATELSAWIRTIRSGAVTPGSVGARNAAHLAARPVAAPRRNKARAKPKAKASKLKKTKAKRKKAKRK
jgi:hypothetical protein